MSSQMFTVDSFEKNKAMGILDLVNDPIKVALCTDFAPNYSSWVGSTPYSEGDIVIPTVRNGYRYRAMNTGTSGSSGPSWPITGGGTVTDNDIVWEEYGGEHADIEFFNSISGNEVSDGDGYTLGGVTLSGKNTVQNSINPKSTKWDAADTTWTVLTKTMRTAWLYVGGDVSGANDYVISYILLNDTPTDIAVDGVDFTLRWNTNGILEFGK